MVVVRRGVISEKVARVEVEAVELHGSHSVAPEVASFSVGYTLIPSDSGATGAKQDVDALVVEWVACVDPAQARVPRPWGLQM